MVNNIARYTPIVKKNLKFHNIMPDLTSCMYICVCVRVLELDVHLLWIFKTRLSHNSIVGDTINPQNTS